MRLFQSHAAFRLILILCLILGLYVPVLSPEFSARAQAGDPPPPPAEDVQPPDRSSSDLPPEVPAEEAELQAALAALEIARQQGPAAILALRATLRGKALDLAMNDIVEAQAQLARQAPPRPPTAAVSLAEEESLQQSQAALDAASRARALTRQADPIEGQAQTSSIQYPTNPNAPAADRTVGSGCTYATLAAAITAANPGDRLLISGGVTFTENVHIPITLTLQGGYNGCASGSTARTTINGGGSGSVVVVDAGLAVTLTNLNLTNGNTGSEGGGIQFALGSGAGWLTLTSVDIYTNTGYWGGGLWVGPDAEVAGTNVEIYNNTAATYGGGVRLYGSRATFTNTNIYNNVAEAGGGVYGSLQDSYAPALNLPSYADIYSNAALTGNGFGGGVHLREGTVSVADCSDIYFNNASAGGGAYLITSTLTIQGDCSEIESNTATGDGGGIYAQGSTVNLDPDTELYDNTAGTGGTGSGGGAYLDNSDLWSDKALIHYNTADDYGGGVYATNSSLLDMDLGGYACTGPRCSQLSYNTATVYGGGVYARDNSEVDLVQTYVENNAASLGGAVYAYQSPVYLTNGMVARNNATGGTGDGLRLYTGSSLSGSSDTLAYNDGGGAATGNAISLSGATLSLINSVIWGHATSVNDATQTITDSDVQGGYAGTGNLNVDPLFVAPASANFHLQSLSPVIDRCATGPAVDADKDPRPVTYIRPATPYDMGADEAGARVGLNGAACAYGRIQDAVDAATSGATIQAVTDVFSEAVDITSKNLTIVGGYDVNCTTYLTGTTTVNGGGAGSVFDITDSLLMLRNLDITGGNGATGGGVDVLSGNSRVTLDNTSVFGNQANHGGGVYVDTGVVLTITNDSDIYNNTADMRGGGVRVWGKFVGGETQSDVYGNSAPDGGGISVPGGTLILNGSDLQGNQATGAQGTGGGIHVYSNGVVTMTGNVWVYEGQAYDGAGIYADAATVYMPGATMIRDNIATHQGGGLYLAAGSRLAAADGSIGDAASNTGNEAVLGAGLYTISSTVNFAGSIINNIASEAGAGLYASGSIITLTNARVGGTGAHEANQLGATGHEGVGLLLTNNTHAILNNTVVSSNTFQTTGYTYGGGALVRAGSVLTLTNSRIERHFAPNVSDGRGAGLYVRGATVTLDNSQIISNTAGTAGGGVRLFGGTLNVTNGSSLINNQALTGQGGAIAATSDVATPDINLSNATLQNNTAATDGGAIYLNAGTLDFTGWWVLRDNIAGGNGGAVAVAGTGVANFHASGAGSSILYNQAGGNGGALYVNNASTLELHSTSGYLLSLSGNQASGHGGAAYADNGGYFDVYGRLIATANNAAGNGGAFYLSGGSRLWLDDYVNDVPELRTNWAQNGGAIYAQSSPKVECDGAVFGDDADGNRATAGSGGAIYLSGSVFKGTNCTFRNNRATQNGGALAAYTSTLTIDAEYAATLAADQMDRLSPTVPQATGCNPLAGQCSAVYGNVADSDTNSSGDGGAIYTNDGVLAVSLTYLHRNSAYHGGAIYQTGTGAVGEVVNSLIYSNTVSHPLGAGIRKSSGAFTVTHATLANNPGGSGFSGVASAAYNTIAWGNGAGGFSAAPISGSCNIDDGGNAGPATNPQFVAPGAGEDYHLNGGSPAVNACATGLARDLDNVARPIGLLFDMGTYEYAVTMTLEPDRSGSGLPLSAVVYTHTLTNLGAADTYTLTAQSSNGWSVTLLPPTPVALNSGQAKIITATVNVPAGVLSGTVDTAVVTATSWANPEYSVAVTDTTLIDRNISVALTPDRNGVATPGSMIVYQHTLTNTGNSADVFDVTHASSQGWVVQVNPPLDLNAGQAATINITVTVPTTVISGTIETTVITATSRANAGQFASVTDTTTTIITTRNLYLPMILKN